jgi:hypothetical protein
MDFQDIQAAALRPSPLELWCQRVPWWQDLANAIPIPNCDQQDLLRALAQLENSQIDTICEEAARAINARLKEQTRQLQETYKEMDTEISKEQTQLKLTTFKASAGTCDDYHQGLCGRIGEVLFADTCLLFFFLRSFSLIASVVWTGTPSCKFDKAMEIEHCFKFGCDFTFESGIHGITTTPAKEWAIVVLNVQAESMGNGRRIRALEDCMQLQLVKDAQLIRSEVIAVILYTGPMVSPSVLKYKK